MKLDVIIDDKNHRIDVPAEMLEAEEFFRKMNRDMDNGWQMGPDFVERPDAAQRCQIAANKLLQSHANQNRLLVELMAAYILKHMPGIRAVNIDTHGEMLNTELIFEEGRRRTPSPPARAALSESEVRERAEQDVSPVYKVGKAWRFAVYDRAANRWNESPAVETEDAARRLRDEAHARLLAAYTRSH
jgi:hypothetical protein